VFRPKPAWVYSPKRTARGERKLRIDGFINRLAPPEGSAIEAEGPLQLLDREDHESQPHLFRHRRLLTLRRTTNRDEGRGQPRSGKARRE
jgi:hypothetical protein